MKTYLLLIHLGTTPPVRGLNQRREQNDQRKVMHDQQPELIQKHVINDQRQHVNDQRQQSYSMIPAEKVRITVEHTIHVV